MDQASLEDTLAGLALGPLRYFSQTGSTNDEAGKWAMEGAEHLSLIVADEQRSGRGRLGRRWFTPAGAALAFSLILRPQIRGTSGAPALLNRLTALGALAVSQTLREHYGLKAEIKWPNDVLLERRKTAGILCEAHWQGEVLSAVILGIGVNVKPASVPPEHELLFPATCLENHLGFSIDRSVALRRILAKLLQLYQELDEVEFISLWEASLAFTGEEVSILENTGALQARGQVLGLDELGHLRLLTDQGETLTLYAGEVHLRPAGL